MLSVPQTEALARGLATIRRQRGLVRWPEDVPAHALDDAYRIHHRLRALLDRDAVSPGSKVSGLKKGGAAGALGLPGPFFAAFPTGALHPSGATVAPDYPRAGVECEIAVRIALTDDGAVTISGMMAALELIEARYDPGDAPDLTLLIADGLATAGGVLGAPRPNWPTDLATRPVRMWLDGALLLEGQVGDRLDDPRRAIEAFLIDGPAHGFHPRDGMILFTGNLLKELWVDPGAEVRAEVEGFAPVEVRFG